MPRAEGDELLQRQVDALGALIIDECPTVRVIGAEGVCRIANLFWELIPRAVLTELLGRQKPGARRGARGGSGERQGKCERKLGTGCAVAGSELSDCSRCATFGAEIEGVSREAVSN